MPVKTPRIQLDKNIPRLLGTAIAREFTARLGDPTQSNRVKVSGTDKQGLLYIHGIGDNPASVFTAENTIGLKELIPNRLVKVRHTESGRFEIIGLASEDAEYVANIQANDQVPVYHEQIVDGGLLPYNSTSILVKGAAYVVDNVDYITTDQITGNLIDGSTDDTSATAITLPGTINLAKLVLIQIDPSTNTLSYKQSATFPASYTINLARSSGYSLDPDSGNAKIGYVKLVYGMTAIQREHFQSEPDIYRLISTSGSGNVDITGTQGETVAVLDNVYLNPSDNEWYKIDTDATATVKVDTTRGVVTNIDDAPTITVRTIGNVSGYTGLTAGSPIYASTTAGGYTQTRPDVSDGGTQIAICEMGYATSTTAIYVDPRPVIYAKRDTMADDGTLTIEHHSDAQTRTRDVRAYVATTVAGSAVAEYGTANQNVAVNLRSSAYTEADYTSGTATASSNDGNLPADAFDDNNSTQWKSAGVTTGWLEYEFASSVAIQRYDVIAPAATLAQAPKDWTFEYYNGSSWTVVDTVTGQTSWSSNETRSFTYTDGTSSTRWRINVTAVDTGGRISIAELNMFEQTTYDKLAQGFQVTGTQTIQSVDLYMKKNATPTGTMTLRIETDNSGSPSGTLVHANATQTVSETTLGSNYADIAFTFASTFSISGSTQYHIVLSTDRAAHASNWAVWGADSTTPSYANGTMKAESSSTWSDLTYDAIFAVNAVGTQYDEPLAIGTYSSGTNEVGVRFDDGAGASGDTKTTFQNQTGASADIVCEVIL